MGGGYCEPCGDTGVMGELCRICVDGTTRYYDMAWMFDEGERERVEERERLRVEEEEESRQVRATRHGTEQLDLLANLTTNLAGTTEGSGESTTDQQSTGGSRRRRQRRRRNRRRRDLRRTRSDPTSTEHPIDLTGEPSTTETPLLHMPTTSATTTTVAVTSNQEVVDLTSPEMEDSDLFHLRDRAIPKTWVLLDNCSTVNVFSNPNLLSNIRPTRKKMRIHCQAGTTETNLVGDFEGYPEPVWYTPDGIANVLSLSKVKAHYRVRYDSDADDGCFVVHQPGGRRKFMESEGGSFTGTWQRQKVTYLLPR